MNEGEAVDRVDAWLRTITRTVRSLTVPYACVKNHDEIFASILFLASQENRGRSIRI